MNGRRAAIALSLICALLVSAWAASSTAAGEAKIITTFFTCKEQTNPAGDAEGFSDEHCNSAATGKNVKFEHTHIFPNRAIEITATNEKTADSTKKSTELLLTGKIGGVNGEIGCTTVHHEGIIANLPGPPMQAWGQELKTKITGCTTKGFMAAIKCKVVGEEIVVKDLTSESKENSMEVFFKPEGKNVGFFTIAGCGLENEYDIDGELAAIPNGATLEFTKASTSGLSMAGAQANLTTKLTTRATEEQGKFKDPIATTTKVVS